MPRVINYLKRIFITIIVFAVLLAGLYVIQYYFHLFDNVIEFINQDIGIVNGTLSAELLTGISIGMIFLVLFIFFFPFFIKGINKIKYLESVYRGVISAFVYFISDQAYRLTEKISRFYFFVTIVIVIMITIILIEIVSLSVKKEKEVEMRTDIVSAIVAGLVFGLVLKLVLYGIDYLKLIISYGAQ